MLSIIHVLYILHHDINTDIMIIIKTCGNGVVTVVEAVTMTCNVSDSSGNGSNGNRNMQ